MTDLASSMNAALERIPCPYCRSERYSEWAREREHIAVRCSECGLLFCNPRPALSLIDNSVRTGTHGDEASGLVVVERRVPSEIPRYTRIFRDMFRDLWAANAPISWLDVGAGYGEVLEAVTALAPTRSTVVGLEPMLPKAVSARSRGLTIIEDYLSGEPHDVDVVSTVDVFSHIPDFNDFLTSVCGVLKPRGNLFIETGNLADLRHRTDFPGELGLPNHLVFAGERHIVGFLQRAGFEVLEIRKDRIDTALYSAKNLVKKLIGRPAVLRLPYTSPYRTMMIRARLTE